MGNQANSKPPDDSNKQVCPKDPELVVVTITHSNNSWDTIGVVIMSDCILKDILEALATKVKRPDVMQLGRFIERVGSTFKKLKLEEPLGERRNLSYMGTNKLN